MPQLLHRMSAIEDAGVMNYTSHDGIGGWNDLAEFHVDADPR